MWSRAMPQRATGQRAGPQAPEVRRGVGSTRTLYFAFFAASREVPGGDRVSREEREAAKGSLWFDPYRGLPQYFSKVLRLYTKMNLSLLLWK